MEHRILVPEVVAACGLDKLLSQGVEVKTTSSIKKEDLIHDLQDCDGVIVRVAKMDAEVLAANPQLKIIGKHGVGVDNIDLDYCREHGIRVVFTPHANTQSVAEHAVTLMLACAKQINHKAACYREEEYAVKDRMLGNEVSGKILGLIGFGNIGSKVARMAHYGFNMTVLAYDPFLEEGLRGDGVEVTHDAERVYRQADFISVHTPATKSTIKSVGKAQFRWMKNTAFIVNTSRGTVIDELALIQALREGEIAGAGLDVSDPEPARKDNPLHGMANVIMTPHCAGVTRDSMDNMSRDVATGIIEVLSGKAPTWPVV
ncbi:MAG: hydroxyacid dehydrogenase [Candidatus Heteroscillospira sp.]|jgi:D-3-phosphoglycerate dehydrogenase